MTDGSCEHTAFGMLRVMITRHNDVWFAQGVEIDYSASGDSLEDVKRRFSDGFCATVQAHLERFGTINKLLRYAPSEALEPFSASGEVRQERFSTVMEHHLAETPMPLADRVRFPGEIVFVTPAAA